MHKHPHICLLTFWLLLSWFILPASAQESVEPSYSDTGARENNRKSESWQQLEILVEIIQAADQELASLKSELQRTKDELDRKQLVEQITLKNNEVESLKLSFEMMATGVDLRLFNEQKSNGSFNWKAELQAVFQPIVAELKQLTEHPRKIERLRTEQSYYATRLPMTDVALQSIAALKDSATTPALKKQFAGLHERWQKRREEMANRLKLVTFELEETLNPSAAVGPSALEALGDLITGRGLNLLLALIAFIATYFILQLLARASQQFAARRYRIGRALPGRIITFVMQATSVLLATFASMAVLYMRGDWLLLGLLLILLVAIAFAAKNSLPRFMNETRLLLNIGPVREGGRVLYNGLPWKVVTLNVYSTLQNPLLRGGTLQLPLSEVGQLVSRRHAEDEPWFPSREGDYVVLEDGLFGRVMAQTPESVLIATGGAIKTYPIHAYLEQKPRNLSQQGFAVGFKFGLDYTHQAQITTTIRAQLEQAINTSMRAHALGTHVRECSVQFDEAAASSLDFIISAEVDAAAAEHYATVRRLLQSFAVDACNAHQWSIPFKQLTVHLATVLPAGNGIGLPESKPS